MSRLCQDSRIGSATKDSKKPRQRDVRETLWSVLSNTALQFLSRKTGARLLSHELQAELEAAVAAAHAAADFIRSQSVGISREGVREKALHDLVTHVDVGSQKIIMESLHNAFPNYGFLAEEDEVANSRLDRPIRWIIDPLDGTTNFTHGVPPYAVSIALHDGKHVLLGVVIEVVSGETFTAIRGEGSYLNGQPMHVSRTSGLDQALVSTGFPYRSVDHVDAYLAVLRTLMVQCRGVRRHGSASIDLAYLAAGRFDGFFETGLMPWDVAAGALLIREAGGTVTDFGRGSDPVFCRQILASNSLLQEEMLAAVRPLASVSA